MHVSFETDIKSDLERVFSWIAVPEKAMVWMTSVFAGSAIKRKIMAQSNEEFARFKQLCEFTPGAFGSG